MSDATDRVVDVTASYDYAVERRRWDEERSRRVRVPLRHCHRGHVCLGLHMDQKRLTLRGDSVMSPDGSTLLAAMRDTPFGAFTGGAMARRGVSYTGTTHSTIEDGVIKFAFDNPLRHWDYQFAPRGLSDDGQLPEPDTLNSCEYPELFRLFNSMNSNMTDYAYYAKQRNRRDRRKLEPVREPWFSRRPDTTREAVPRIDPASYMPVPYVLVSREQRDRVYDIATSVGSQASIQCKSCEKFWVSDRYRDPKFCEDSPSFQATCPECKEVGDYVAEDIVVGMSRPHYTSVLRAMFCDSFSGGLPLLAPETVTRVGAFRSGELKTAVYQGVYTGARYEAEVSIDLPLPPLGVEVAAGKPICYLLGSPDLSSGCKNAAKFAEISKVPGLTRAKQWAAIRAGFGTDLRRVMRLWLQFQGVKATSFWGNRHTPVEGMEDVYFYPYRLLSSSAQFATRDLWWDITPSLAYLDDKTGAIAFPPIRQRRPEDLEFKFAGIRIDANITDPRFQGW